MKYVMFLVGALALVAGLAAPAGAKPDRPTVPFAMSMQSTDSSFVPASPERCPNVPGADFISMFSGVGNATHLGRFTFEAQHCTDLETGTYGDGFMSFTAANGDVLEMTYTNGVVSGVPPVTPISDEITFVDGGSGRFARASGGLVESGVFDFATEQVTLSGRGTISYGR